MMHTPGPWKAGAMSVGTDEGEDSRPICCMIGNREYAEHEANARLMGAAPDLLAACKNILETWWNRHYPEDIFDGSSGDEGALEIVRIRAMLQAAIARAKGEEPE